MKVYYCLFLQFRERDELARIFKSWMQPQSSSSILMSNAWDHRVRQHLGTRYNSKSGCFDWDLTMKLHEKGVFKDLVHFPLFVDYTVLPKFVQFFFKAKKFGGLSCMLRRRMDIFFCAHCSSAVWRHQQTTVCAMEGAWFGVRNEGRCVPNNQSKSALFKSVQSGKFMSVFLHSAVITRH